MTAKIPIFEGISDPTFHEFLSTAPVRKFPKGMIIFDQGEMSEEIFCVASGLVEVVRQDEEGDLKHVADLIPGTIFGEFSYLTGEPRSSATVAKEETTLVELSASWLREVEQKHPEVRKRLLDLYRKRVLQNVLQGCKLFSVLSSEQLSQIALKMVQKTLKDGDEIIREGATDLSLIVIKKGKVVVTKRKGKDKIVLGELKTGEVLGEMAVVTGEPRSASAFAVGETQIMELPGDDFKAALSTYPKLLKSIEDIVKSRAAQTRKAVEEVLDEVLGTEWTENQDISGIQLESLKASVGIDVEGETGDVKLLRASLHRWELESEKPIGSAKMAGNMRLTLRRGRMKELDADLVKEPIPASIVAIDGQKMAVALLDEPGIRARLSKILTSLARARVRLFVYPEYDVTKLSITLEFRAHSGMMGFCGALSMSLTHARIRASDGWKPGEIASVLIHQGEKEVASLKALCLDTKEGVSEVQFEFETGAERAALEELLRQLSRQLGYGQAAATTSPLRKTPSAEKAGLTLTKHFQNPGEFVRTYMGSIESGIIHVPLKDALSIGTQVTVHLSIGGERGVRRLALTGIVRDWKSGMTEIEIDELTDSLREKIEQLCRKLVEQRTDQTWKKRKDELIREGIPVETESSSTLKRSIVSVLIVAIIGAAIGWNVRSKSTVKSPPVPEQIRVADAPIDVEILLQTATGPVTVRSSRIESLRPIPEEGMIEVLAEGRTLKVTQNETEKLPPFFKKQLETLRELQKNP